MDRTEDATAATVDSTGESSVDSNDDSSTEPTLDSCTDPTCYCQATGVVEALGRKYAIPVLCALAAHESLRFGNLEDHLPAASTSTLSDRLSELDERGLVERRQFDEIPPRVEYRLSDDGRELGALLEPLVEWAAHRD